MSKSTKKLNIELFRLRYFKSKRKEKSRLLDELCDLYGFNSKYLLQIFNGLIRRQQVKRGPKRRYVSKDLLELLTQIWLATDQMCSRKLAAAIKLWLPHYENEYGNLEGEVKNKLLKMSHSTIDRLLKPSRLKYKKHRGDVTFPHFRI